MEFITILLIAVGLAMDAFAVSVSNGVAVNDFRLGHGVKLGFYFGGFQFVMPIIGWILGNSVKNYIESVDHWIAFVLLGAIGLNMILETRKTQDKELSSCMRCADEVLSVRLLTLQAVATSIDALAVGISFALLDINIVFAAAIIGAVAFLFSFAGGVLGKGLGGLFKQKAEFFGGAILIAIGIKILSEHLFFG